MKLLEGPELSSRLAAAMKARTVMVRETWFDAVWKPWFFSLHEGSVQCTMYTMDWEITSAKMMYYYSQLLFSHILTYWLKLEDFVHGEQPGKCQVNICSAVGARPALAYWLTPRKVLLVWPSFSQVSLTLWEEKDAKKKRKKSFSGRLRKRCVGDIPQASCQCLRTSHLPRHRPIERFTPWVQLKFCPHGQWRCLPKSLHEHLLFGQSKIKYAENLPNELPVPTDKSPPTCSDVLSLQRWRGFLGLAWIQASRRQILYKPQESSSTCGRICPSADIPQMGAKLRTSRLGWSEPNDSQLWRGLKQTWGDRNDSTHWVITISAVCFRPRHWKVSMRKKTHLANPGEALLEFCESVWDIEKNEKTRGIFHLIFFLPGFSFSPLRLMRKPGYLHQYHQSRNLDLKQWWLEDDMDDKGCKKGTFFWWKKRWQLKVWPGTTNKHRFFFSPSPRHQ